MESYSWHDAGTSRRMCAFCLTVWVFNDILLSVTMFARGWSTNGSKGPVSASHGTCRTGIAIRRWWEDGQMA